MPKTKLIQASCKSIESYSETHNSMMLTVVEPDVEQVLEDIHKEDLADFVQDKFSPDDLFTEKQLDSWAEENGYTKE